MIERAISFIRGFVFGGFMLMIGLGVILGVVSILAALISIPLDWANLLPASDSGWRKTVVDLTYGAGLWVGGLGGLFFFAFIVEFLLLEPFFRAWERHQERIAPTIHETIWNRYLESLKGAQPTGRPR